jgi:hypothetical protein
MCGDTLSGNSIPTRKGAEDRSGMFHDSCRNVAEFAAAVPNVKSRMATSFGKSSKAPAVFAVRGF